MRDEPDPPRVVYGFKAREFDRVNTTSPHAKTGTPPPSRDPSAPPTATPSTERIDVIELNKIAAGNGPQIGIKPAAVKPTEIHAMLRENYVKDAATGGYDLGTLDDSKRRRRIRNYCIANDISKHPARGIGVSGGRQRFHICVVHRWYGAVGLGHHMGNVFHADGLLDF